jgi:bifunctional non-homologous end joining protein LigD
VGYIPFFGARGKVGSLLLALRDADGVFHFAGAVRAGFTGAVRVQLARLLEKDYVQSASVANAPALGDLERWALPKYVAEVEFADWSHEGCVRHPTFRELREDKQPGECIRKDAPRTDNEAAFRNVVPLAAEASVSPC